MTAIYKVKFTRNSTSDKWPIEQFSDSMVTEYHSLPSDTLYQPAGGIQNFLLGITAETVGLVDTSYDEYDSSYDLEESAFFDIIHSSDNSDALTLKTFAFSDGKVIRIFNPSTLVHTLVFTFDTWENLQSFLLNCSWDQGPTKAEFNAYLTSVGQTVEETFINDGAETTSPISLFS